MMLLLQSWAEAVAAAARSGNATYGNKQMRLEKVVCMSDMHGGGEGAARISPRIWT